MLKLHCSRLGVKIFICVKFLALKLNNIPQDCTNNIRLVIAERVPITVIYQAFIVTVAKDSIGHRH